MDKETLQKSKNKKVLIGIIAAAVLLLGLIFGSITIAGNAPARRADKYLDLGNKYLNELDYEQALVAYRQVLEIEPKNLGAYKGALQASEGLGDRDGMAEFYTAALGMIESMTEQELKSVYDTAVEIYLYADAVYSDDHEAVALAMEKGFDSLGGDERIIRELIEEYGILAEAYIDEGDNVKEQEIYKKILEKGLENAEALSGWEQRVRDRFQEYLSKNGGSGNAPEPTAEPTPEPTPVPTPEPTSEPTSAPVGPQGNVIDSGEYKGLSWQVTDAGELAVTGHMEGEGLDSKSIWWSAPWRQYKDVTTVAYMSFTGAKSLSNLFGDNYPGMGSLAYEVLSEVNLNGLDTSSVTDMSCMFYACNSLNSVDVSGFDTSSVTDMWGMFGCCSSLSSVDVSGFDTGSVTSMDSMFEYCSSLSSLDLRSFDTSSVTNMSNMFGHCSSLSSVDVSSFDTSSVTAMSYMFRDCSNLQEILVGDGWQVPAQSDRMFNNCGVSDVTHK